MGDPVEPTGGPRPSTSFGERLAARLEDFGAAALELAARIPSDPTTRHIPPQLARAATSVGANYAEACGAASRRDFIHKLRVVDQEARESRYWLRLVARRWPDLIGAPALACEAGELVGIVTASIRTALRREEEA
jgi:four helix bundle protein